MRLPRKRKERRDGAIKNAEDAGLYGYRSLPARRLSKKISGSGADALYEFIILAVHLLYAVFQDVIVPDIGHEKNEAEQKEQEQSHGKVSRCCRKVKSKKGTDREDRKQRRNDQMDQPFVGKEGDLMQMVLQELLVVFSRGDLVLYQFIAVLPRRIKGGSDSKIEGENAVNVVDISEDPFFHNGNVLCFFCGIHFVGIRRKPGMTVPGFRQIFF